MSFDNTPQNLLFDGRILNAENAVYTSFAGSFESTFRGDMSNTIAGSPMPFLSDMDDFNNLFGDIYVDSICILPIFQKSTGPTSFQYNNPEACWVAGQGTGRDQIATLTNPSPPLADVLSGRTAKGLQIHGSEVCFQTGGQSLCSIVISFVIAPKWRATLGPLSSAFDFIRSVADRAGSQGSWRRQWGQPSVSAVPTIKVINIIVPSGTAALRPFLSLVAAAALVFFL